MTFNASHAVLMAAKYCRQFPLFQWREEAIPNIGRRQDKFWCRVNLTNLRNAPCTEMVLSLFSIQHSLFDFQKEDTLYALKALLVTLKHPYILPVVDVYYSKEKKALLVIQPFIPNGSLKDRIHRSCPTRPYNEKYHTLCRATPLSYQEISRFGKQILQAMNALRAKGIYCEHLSSGNIIIEHGNARISDIYSPLLAIDRSSALRELTVPLEAQGVEVDVLLFGHILYEMVTGIELCSTTPEESVLDLMAPHFAEVFRFIFYRVPQKTTATASVPCNEEDDVETLSIVTNESSGEEQYSVIEQLLQKGLFRDANVPDIEQIFSGFRFDSSMKITVRRSMKINSSRNTAHIVLFREQQALTKARQRAERRAHERERPLPHKQKNMLYRHKNDKNLVMSTRGSYRAHSFRSHLERSSSSAA